MPAHWRGPGPFTALLLGVAVISLAVAWLRPFAWPMPGYFADAQLWAATGRIADTFTPLLYPLFLGPALRLGGVPGVVALQVVLQIILAAIAYRLVRALALSPRAAAWAAMPVAFHPDLLASITKAWDVPLSTALLLLSALLCLTLLRAGARSLPWLGLATGLALGAGIACRPNYSLLLPGVLVALWLRPQRPGAREVLATCTGTIAGALLCFALAGVLSHGSIFFPRNGPYNLFAGHNRYTASSLVDNLNAEPSLVRSLAEDAPPSPDPYAPVNGPWYTAQTAAFARSHPGTELGLLPLKLWTLFRPDTKVHLLPSPLGLARLLLALPILLLLLVALAPPRPILRAPDRLLLLLETLYVLPFLITNADPRFRTPLDALLLLHAASLLWRRLTRDNPVKVRT